MEILLIKKQIGLKNAHFYHWYSTVLYMGHSFWLCGTLKTSALFGWASWLDQKQQLAQPLVWVWGMAICFWVDHH